MTRQKRRLRLLLRLAIVLLFVLVAHLDFAHAKLAEPPELPESFRSEWQVTRIMPVFVEDARYAVLQLSTKLDEYEAINRDMRYGVLVTKRIRGAGAVTHYFQSGFWCFAGKELKYRTDFEGKVISAFLEVDWGTGGNAYGTSRCDVLELSSGGVRSLLDMVKAAGFHGNIEKLVFIDSKHGYPDILLNDDSFYTVADELLPVSSERWNFPTFPRILRIEGLRLCDVTPKISDYYKRRLVQTAEGGGYVGARYGDPLDSRFELTVPYCEPRQFSDVGEHEYLCYAISVLATYYSIGWKEEGVKRFEELVSSRAWDYPFQYAAYPRYPDMEAVAAQCIKAVEEVFAGRT